MIHYRLLQSLSSLVLLLACSLTVVESFLPASSCWGPTRTSCKDETTQLASQIRENSDVTFSSRRHFWNTFAAVGLSIATTTAPAHAFERADAKFAYSITIPESLKEGSKPVKTHQDEINFVASEIRGYQYGITADPVRINSLKEVGENIRIGKKPYVGQYFLRLESKDETAQHYDSLFYFCSS